MPHQEDLSMAFVVFKVTSEGGGIWSYFRSIDEALTQWKLAIETGNLATLSAFLEEDVNERR
jgi:hypothetical protein